MTDIVCQSIAVVLVEPQAVARRVLWNRVCLFSCLSVLWILARCWKPLSSCGWHSHVFRKNLFCLRENGPKIGAFHLKKNLVVNFHWICSKMKICYYYYYCYYYLINLAFCIGISLPIFMHKSSYNSQRFMGWKICNASQICVSSLRRGRANVLFALADLTPIFTHKSSYNSQRFMQCSS